MPLIMVWKVLQHPCSLCCPGPNPFPLLLLCLQSLGRLAEPQTFSSVALSTRFLCLVHLNFSSRSQAFFPLGHSLSLTCPVFTGSHKPCLSSCPMPLSITAPLSPFPGPLHLVIASCLNCFLSYLTRNSVGTSITGVRVQQDDRLRAV